MVSISEVLGFDGEHVKLQEIFAFRQTGIGEDGKVLGELKPTGALREVLEQPAAAGEALPAEMFTVDGVEHAPRFGCRQSDLWAGRRQSSPVS